MPAGYMGKILRANLTDGRVWNQTLDEETCRSFIGGYGLGCRTIFHLIKPGIDPLGPDNILGFFTSPLAGTPAVGSSRFEAVGKSPLTGGWGDANCGGDFAPYLKFAGYDAIIIEGVSDRPVYLLVDNGRAVLHDAADFWGRDTYETERAIGDRHGGAKVVCIGPAGEKTSLIAGIMTKHGSTAARSGLGAVMGAKRLKAVAVNGNYKPSLAHHQEADGLKRQYVDELRRIKVLGLSYLELYHRYGTSGWTREMIEIGSSPFKNWGGSFTADMPDYGGLTGEAASHNRIHNEGCWRCPVACKGILDKGRQEYPYQAGLRRPEYETQIAFGAMCLNNNADSINMANDICNRHGIDTISAGTTVAFAIECYQNGIISKEETDGLELTWGNSRSIVALTEKIARREGFGAVLADGVALAARRIGRGAEKFAVHVGGQEPGMHDPKLGVARKSDRLSAARYLMDATPGRHTQGFGPSGFEGHLLNCLNLCLHAGYKIIREPMRYFTGFLNSVTGWDTTGEELLKVGERAATLRHLFNLRESINPRRRFIHPRMLGLPPLTSGVHTGVTIDIDEQVNRNLDALDWDRTTTAPSLKKLHELGLETFAP
jgi:aldehyde:ferredoxin oxidoreductase